MCEYSFGYGPNGVVPPNADHQVTDMGSMGGARYTAYGLTDGGNGGTGPAVATPGRLVAGTYYTCFTRNDYVYTTDNVSG